MKLSHLIVLVLSLSGWMPLQARTIELTDIDADLIAAIRAEAPRMGWACFESGVGMFTTDYVGLKPDSALLIRVPLERIPPGVRITKAEWIVKVAYQSVDRANLYVWRLTTDWGAGACYQYRTTTPQPTPWAVEGARGSASDRADKPTAVVPCRIYQEVTINVTSDVELWYSGAVPNHGWMFTVEDPIDFRLNPPAYNNRGGWKLRITYEPQ